MGVAGSKLYKTQFNINLLSVLDKYCDMETPSFVNPPSKYREVQTDTLIQSHTLSQCVISQQGQRACRMSDIEKKRKRKTLTIDWRQLFHSGLDLIVSTPVDTEKRKPQ